MCHYILARVIDNDKSEIYLCNYIEKVIKKVIILIPFAYIHEIYFPEFTFAFSVKPCEKSGCGKPHPDIFQSSFDLCVPIKYKIRFVKPQKRELYVNFVI